MNGKALTDKERFWRKMIRDYNQGNGTVRDLCDRHGVSAQSFYRWKSKLEDSTDSPDAERSFSEIRVVSGEIFDQAPPQIELLLSRGRKLHVVPGFDETTLVRLIALLESDRC